MLELEELRLVFLCGRTFGASQFTAPAFTFPPKAQVCANWVLLRRATLLAEFIWGAPDC